MDIKRTERGWAGHFICADRCMFRRNTLLEKDEVKVVISTVGLMKTSWKEGEQFYRGPFEEIGCGRYFETIVFMSNPVDTRYHDADVTREVRFNSPWSITEVDADDRANDMHENVVAEITNRLLAGEDLEQREV